MTKEDDDKAETAKSSSDEPVVEKTETVKPEGGEAESTSDAADKVDKAEAVSAAADDTDAKPEKSLDGPAESPDDGAERTAQLEEPAAQTEATEDDGPSDAEILIAELKASLASSQTLLQTQASRLATLNEVETQLAQVKDQLVFVTAAKDAVEKRLAEEKDKREAAEEQMEALRGQVEAARRGVGLLHKQSEMERKRYSQMGGMNLGSHGPQGLGLISGAGEDDGGAQGAAGGSSSNNTKDNSSSGSLGVTDRASKRQSMIWGSRVVSEGDASSNLSIPGTAPRGLRELRLGAAGGGSSTSPAITSPTTMSTNPMDESSPRSRRLSVTSRNSAAGGSSPKKETPSFMASAGSTDSSSEETQKLRVELLAVHRKLEESEEARLASEACLKALREFVALGSGTDTNTVDLTDESSAGLLKGISLPPLPTDRDTDADAPPPAVPAKEMSSPKKAPATSWGFNKLWRQNSAVGSAASPAPSTIVEPPQTPQLLSPSAAGKNADLPKSNVVDLDEPHVAAVPAATPRNFISSWTRAVAGPASASGTPAPGASTPTATGVTIATGTPVPPTNTRKLSSFFGIGKREDAKDAHTDFEAGDAFTPQHPAQDKLEPSLMVDEQDEDQEAERVRAEANRLSKEVGMEHASSVSEAGTEEVKPIEEAKNDEAGAVAKEDKSVAA